MGGVVNRIKKHLKGKILGCHCSPEACHAETLAHIANDGKAKHDKLFKHIAGSGKPLCTIQIVGLNVGGAKENKSSSQHQGGVRDHTPLLDITLVAECETPTILNMTETHWNSRDEKLLIHFLEEEDFSVRAKCGGNTAREEYYITLAAPVPSYEINGD